MATICNRIIRSMPDRICDAYDPLGHRTYDDLIFLAIAEIDLADEGQDGFEPLTAKERKQIKAWIAKCKVAKAKGHFTACSQECGKDSQ